MRRTGKQRIWQLQEASVHNRHKYNIKVSLLIAGIAALVAITVFGFWLTFRHPDGYLIAKHGPLFGFANEPSGPACVIIITLPLGLALAYELRATLRDRRLKDKGSSAKR